MKFDSEKEMEDLIYSHYQETGRVIIDDHYPQYFKRQLNIGDYGIIDLISMSIEPKEVSKGRDRCVFAKIYELKNGPITIDAVSQISRYRTGLVDAFRAIEGFDLVEVELALVGLSIDSCCHVIQSAKIEYYQADFDVTNGLDFVGRSDGWAITGASTGRFLFEFLADEEE